MSTLCKMIKFILADIKCSTVNHFIQYLHWLKTTHITYPIISYVPLHPFLAWFPSQLFKYRLGGGTSKQRKLKGLSSTVLVCKYLYCCPSLKMQIYMVNIQCTWIINLRNLSLLEAAVFAFATSSDHGQLAYMLLFNQ